MKDKFPVWKEYWRSKSLSERKALARNSQCSFLHLRNMATNDVQPSPTLAIKIELACGYPKEMLRPDIFGEYKP